jgi:hypothetical protein
LVKFLHPDRPLAWLPSKRQLAGSAVYHQSPELDFGPIPPPQQNICEICVICGFISAEPDHQPGALMKKPKPGPAKPHTSIRPDLKPPTHAVHKHPAPKVAPKHPVKSPTPNRRGR